MSYDGEGKPFNEPEAESTFYPVRPEPTGPAASCPDCRGSGRVMLLTSSRPCNRCGGAGRIEATGGTAAEPAAEGSDACVYAYDPQGRLTSVTMPRGNVTSIWRFEG